MAVTVTTDSNLKDIVEFDSVEDININDGATLTITETPSQLLRYITINDGELHIDGTNITAGNLINCVGEGDHDDYDRHINVRGQGKLKITGGWYSIGTTDGSVAQSIDMSTATGSGYWNNLGSDFCVDSIPMLQVETGRRLNYINGVGVAPKIGDFIYKASDTTVMGKIHSVGVDYVVVWMMTDSLLDGDDLVIRSVVDNVGADFQRSFTCTMDGADVKEIGVYMEFGNARSGGVDYASAFGSGYGGLVFNHTFGATTLTIGEGYLPPSGCDIRVPNVILNTASQTAYNNGDASGESQSDATILFGLELSYGGDVYINTCNFGNSSVCDATAYKYEAHYVGVSSGIGSTICASKAIFNHCVGVQSSECTRPAPISTWGCVQDLVNGADVSFCMNVSPRLDKQYFGSATSLDVNINDCITTKAGQGSDISNVYTYGYYFNKATGGSIINCMYFGNTDSSQQNAIYLSVANQVDVKNFYTSATQDYTDGCTTETDTLRVATCNDINIIGLDVIGNNGNVQGNSLVYVIDTNNCKVRAIGMIDDKINMGTDGEYVTYITGLSNNIDVSRCWKFNGEHEEAVGTNNTSKNLLIQNCSGDYLSRFYPKGGDNTRFRGVHGGAGAVGDGTNGIEDSYTASYGNSWHDNFTSDTKGNLILTMITPSDDYNETTIVSGNPKFFKDGDLDMRDGDVIIFEMGYESKGHISFTGNFTSACSGADWYADEWNHLDIEFQYDVGGGWNDVWLDLRTPTNLTNISNFEDGIKLKVKLTSDETGETNMSLLIIETNTTLQIQKDNFYPIDQHTVNTTITVKDIVTGAVLNGARVYLKGVGGDLDGVVIFNTLTDENGQVSDTRVVGESQAVVGRVRHSTTPNFFKTVPINETIDSDNGLTLNVAMIKDI